MGRTWTITEGSGGGWGTAILGLLIIAGVVSMCSKGPGPSDTGQPGGQSPPAVGARPTAGSDGAATDSTAPWNDPNSGQYYFRVKVTSEPMLGRTGEPMTFTARIEIARALRGWDLGEKDAERALREAYWEWDFAYGQNVHDTQRVSGSNVETHTYSTAGQYTVRVKAMLRSTDGGAYPGWGELFVGVVPAR